jgi:hypothetical protein
MTIEQAKSELMQMYGALAPNKQIAIDTLIKASVKSQEPILDKIRAEMFEEMLSHSGTGEEVIQAYTDGLKKGLDILDKYKAESEDKE